MESVSLLMFSVTFASAPDPFLKYLYDLKEISFFRIIFVVFCRLDGIALHLNFMFHFTSICLHDNADMHWTEVNCLEVRGMK